MLHQIGAGALGPVFRAYQPEQDRLVAVKLFRIDIPPERTHQLVVQLERLIAGDLTHAGIAAPLAAGLSEVSAYLAMDFVAADSLDIVIRDQQTSAPADVVRVATQLASALDLAAAIDILHGALHPRDVLLSADDVRLTGIGIAHALEEVGFAAPVRRPYTAPERASGAAWDRRADVFSLAALVFELLTRRRILGPGNQPFDSYASVAGASADALDRVFDRALADRPGDRFATAGDFAKALQAAVERKRPVAGRVGASIRPPAPEPVVASPSQPPLTAEELPLFTDSMLGERPDPTALGHGAPRSIAGALHEPPAHQLAVDNATLSMVESQHEPRSTPPQHSMPVNKPPDAPRELSLKRHEPELDIGDVLDGGAAPEPPSRPAPFESVNTESRSASGVWPLMLALVVGIALGFGMAMLLLGRDRVPPAPQQAVAPAASGRTPTEVRDEPVREVTEQTVEPASKPAAPAPVTPEASRPVASAPAPAQAPPANPRVGATKPGATTAPKAAADRAEARAAKTPTPRPQGRTVVAPARTTPPSSRGAAAPARSAAGASKAAATPASGRGARTPPATSAKAAVQAPANASAGSLVVDSRPPGASVYVDGRRVGTTPLVLDTLKAGQYTIGLDIDGYRRWATTVKVTAGERSRVAASLER